MKTLLLPILATITLLSISAPVVLGQTFGETAENRLKKIEKTNATTSAKPTSKTKITFVEGSIVSIQTNFVVLEAMSGNKVIYTTDSTKYFQLDGTKKLIGFGDLKINDKITVLGLVPSSSSGTAKFIVRDQTKTIKNFSLFGQIVSASATELKLTPTDKKDTTLNLSVSADLITIDLKKKVIGLNEASQSQDKIVTTGIVDEKNSPSIKKIMVLRNLSKQSATSSSR